MADVVRATGPAAHRGPRPRCRALVATAFLFVAVVGCSHGAGSSPRAAGDARATTSGPQAGATGATDAAATTVSTVPLSPACTRPDIATLRPGAHDGLTLESGGLIRTYREFVPSTDDPARPAPLVLNLHGLTETIALQVDFTGFESKAQQVRAVVVTPLGGAPGPAWNASRDPGLPDDVGFIRQLITSVERSVCIDPTRVYAMGMSNGSEMTSQLACSLSDEIAAFAAVSGIAFPPGCRPLRKVPIIAFHGTADPDLAFYGGLGPAGKKLIAGLTGAKAITARSILALGLAPVPTVAAKWAVTVDGCRAQPVVVRVSTHVERRTFTGCKGGSTVVLYVIAGGGHTWPGSAFSAATSSLLGPTTMEIDANDLIWSFFEQHPLPAGLVPHP